MSNYVMESTVEEAALGWFAELGYEGRHGADIARAGPEAERAGYGEVVLVARLRAALARINPAVPAAAREEALRSHAAGDCTAQSSLNRGPGGKAGIRAGTRNPLRQALSHRGRRPGPYFSVAGGA